MDDPTEAPQPTDLRTLVATDAVDADVAALCLLLTERGVPLVVVSADVARAEDVRRAFAAQVRAAQPSRDAIAGGAIFGGSLEDILRLTGDTETVSDDARDLGVVLVFREGRLQVAHYVRPVERDAAGHLQHRPPAVLAARDAASGELDTFYWAFTEELATRAGMERAEFEDEHAARTRRLQLGPLTADSSTARDH